MLDFDLAGNPAILYEKSGVKTLASWDGGGWRIEPVWPGISGAGYDFAFDPSGFATIAANVAAGSRVDVKYFRRTGATSAPWESETVTARVSLGAPTALAFNPMDGSPAILYVYLPKPGQGVPRLAERHGTTWSSQDVPLRWSHGARRTLAFDPAGNPAFTAIRDVDGVDDVAFAYRENGVWKVERVVGPPTDGVPWGYVHLSNGLAFDPVRGDFSAVCMPPSGPNGSDQVLFCERSAGTWTCEAIDAGFDIGPSLAIRADGSVFVAYGRSGARIVAHRSPGGTWEREYVDWNTGDSLTLIKLGPDGRPAISWFGAHDATGAGLSDSVCLAQRQ